MIRRLLFAAYVLCAIGSAHATLPASGQISLGDLQCEFGGNYVWTFVASVSGGTFSSASVTPISVPGGISLSDTNAPSGSSASSYTQVWASGFGAEPPLATTLVVYNNATNVRFAILRDGTVDSFGSGTIRWKWNIYLSPSDGTTYRACLVQLSDDISISDYYRGGSLVPDTPANAGVPTSGQIKLSDFYGASR